jgi:hypothetical protein
MAWVRMSLAAAVLAALAIAVAPAAAQEPTQTPSPTATPSPTPTPAPERSKAERAVYRDYRRDGVIEACDHERRTLREVLRELPPEADIDNPDLRPALEAAIDQHDDGDCDEPEPTPTPTATATPAPTSPPAPTTAPDAGSVDPLPPATGGGSSPPPSAPPDRGDVDPLPEVTPVPPATTPVPATPPPAEPSGPEVTPAPVYSNADDGLPVSLLVLAAVLALLALLALAFAAASRFPWADRYLAGPRRAFREASFRAGGTWADFADWLRFGR